MGEATIPAVDKLNKTLQDYILQKYGNFSVPYFQPSPNNIKSIDTHLCFTAPEYANIANTSGSSKVEGFSNKSSVFSKIEGFTLFDNNFECQKSKNRNNTTFPNKGISIIPILKSNNDQGYTCNQSSSWNNNYTAHNVFDGSITGESFWNSTDTYDNVSGSYKGSSSLNGIKGEWISITLPQPKIIAIYDVYQRSDGCCGGSKRNPSTWFILGSNDAGKTWTTIDNQSNEYFPTNDVKNPKTYSIKSPNSYSTYAFITTITGNCDQNHDKTSVQIQEWKLYLQPAPVPKYDMNVQNSPYSPPIQMVKFDNQFYTPDQCKFNLAQKFKNTLITEYFQTIKTTVSKPGLQMKFDNSHYFNDNVSHFDKIAFSAGYYSTFNQHIQQAVAPNKPNDWSKPFSCEWFGFIQISKSDKLLLTMGSDDSSLLWFGNSALYEYNLENTLINNSGVHGVIERNGTTPLLNANQPYPIRIQYGQNYGGTDFYLRIHDSQNNEITNCYYTLINADGSIFFPSTIYYSLVSPEKKNKSGLYYCYYYLAKGNINNSIVSAKASAKYAFIDIWSFEKTSTLSPGNYLLLGTDGNLYFCNDGNGTKINITNISVTGTGSFTASLTNTGDLIVLNNGSQIWSLLGDDNNNVSYVDTPENLIINKDWLRQISENHILSTINAGQKISQTDIEYIISPNGKYKLEINPYVYNLRIRATVSPYQISNGDKTNPVKHTIETDNAYYLYRLDFDIKLGQYFYANKTDNTLEYMPTNVQNPNLHFGNNYMSYQNAFPDSALTAQPVDSLTTCETNCNDNPLCDFFYHYRQGAKSYCAINTDSKILPKLISPDSVSIDKRSIVNPSLYIRKYDISANLAFGETLNVTPLTDYGEYNNYNIKPNSLTDIKPFGLLDDPTYKKLVCQIKQKTVDAETYKQDNCSSIFPSEGFTDKHGSLRKIKNNFGEYNKEGMTTTPFGAPLECYDTSGINKITCPQSIINNQIQPLQKSAQEYQGLTNKVQQNERHLSKNVDKYNKTRQQLTNSGVYDYAGNTLNVPGINQPKTLYDGLDRDIRSLVEQENNMYLLGGITIATLFISAIYIGRN
jgi:hypothetical protein